MTEPDTAAQVRIERLVYGGFGLGRRAHASVEGATAASGETTLVPFALPGELVEIASRQGNREAELRQIFESSPERTTPGCPHFGACGGCHLQMATYDEQLRLKREVLIDSLRRAGVIDFPEPSVHASEPWGYRNRIRLRLGGRDRDNPEHSEQCFGYTRRGAGQEFLPIATCPIAAPLLWRAAETILSTAAREPALRSWLEGAREVELFTDGEQARLQITLLCPRTPKLANATPSSFEQGMTALNATLPELAGAGAVETSWSPLRLGRTLASWGSSGLSYTVSGESYWVERGGFFQVNRFLLPTLVELVCGDRTGTLAWDLFAGVGLFSRVLARRFAQVTAVEAHPGSAKELARALGRLGAGQPGAYRAEGKTTLAFLQQAVLERDRPELIVLDPPRAGAGAEACDLLLRLGSRPKARAGPAPHLVYVSCDPVTLGRDLAILQRGYTIRALHLVDLFPQTYHQEAVVTLEPRA